MQLCFSHPHSRSTAARPRYKPSHRTVYRGMRVPVGLDPHARRGALTRRAAALRRLASEAAKSGCRGRMSGLVLALHHSAGLAETIERMRGSRSRRRSRRCRAPCPWRSGRREPVGSHGRRAGREGPELRRPCGVGLPRHRTTGGQRAWAVSTGPAERGSRLNPLLTGLPAGRIQCLRLSRTPRER